MRSADDLTAVARIRDAAIDQVGRHGFNVGLRAIAQGAGVSAALVIHHFGSKEGLLKACDDYIAEEVRRAKSESLTTSADPASWLQAIAEIDSFAPMTAYLVRSLQSGSDLAKAFWQQMVDNAEQYLEEGVRAGTLKPSRDPKARAKFLSMIGGGGLLLYLHMHPNPTDLRAVLRDYGDEIMLPALELYTNGLLADSTMYETFLAAREQANSFSNPTEGDHDDGDVDAAG